MSNGVNLNLPEEVIFDILSRLPSKSLCRFRCVCNSWCTLISDPHFVQTHLNRNRKNEKVIFFSGRKSLYSIDCSEASNNDAVIATNLKLDLTSIGCVDDILCSCNGLLLVVNDKNTKILLNPSTRKFKKLPKSSSDINFSSWSKRIYGLGYDSSIDDYKVVQVLQFDTFLNGSFCSDTYVNVYTVGTDSWILRWIPDYTPYHIFGPGSGVLLNGYLHWLAYKRSNDHSYVFCAFDLTSEKFQDVSVPSSLEGNQNSNDLGILLLGGCLSVLVCRNSTQTDVWVMKEYGMAETWTKFTICLPNSMSFGQTPLMFSLVDGVVLVLLEMDGNKLVAYNSKEETSRDIMVHGIPSMFRASKTYVESLIWPHYKCHKGIQKLKRKR